MPSIRIQPYTEDWTTAVRDFNDRVTVGLDAELRFPENHVPDYPQNDGAPIFQEYHLAVEDAAVRGAFCLTFERWKLDEEVIAVSHYRRPLSEGIRDKTYKTVSEDMIRAALARQPYLYSIGMGGLNGMLAKSLKRRDWSLIEIPFLFKVNHPYGLLRQSPALRKTGVRKVLLDAAAFSGAGWLTIKSLQAFRSAGSVRAPEAEIVSEFAGWTDEVWEKAAPSYRFLVSRDRASLNLRYPPGQQRFLRLKVGTSGWAVLLDTAMKDNKYFGDLRVGTIVDLLARPEEAPEVVAAATRELERRGVDLLVTNQSHHVWVDAFHRAGFLDGPSNYAYAVSPPLAKRLGNLGSALNDIHLTRGDGPGPERL